MGLSALADAKKILSWLRERTDSVLIAYSGGKDSLVALDLASGFFPKIYCFHMWLIDNLDCMKSTLAWPTVKYGIPVRQYPHNELSDLYRDARYRPHTEKSQGLRRIKQADIYNQAREDSGIEWIVTGMKQSDGLHRMMTLRNMEMEAIEPRSKKVSPLTHWKKGEVFSYIKLNRLLTPVTFGDGKRNSDGINLQAPCLRFLRDNWPDDYAKVLKEFPFAGAVLEREKLYGGTN